MATKANDNVFEDQEIRKLYIESVKLEIAEELEYMVISSLAGEATERLAQGFTVKTYKTFWKKIFAERKIYYFNIGSFCGAMRLNNAPKKTFWR